MTIEQWNKLKEDNVVQYERNRYRLLFKDPIGYWLTEVIDIFNEPMSFRKLVFKTENIRGFSLVK